MAWARWPIPEVEDLSPARAVRPWTPAPARPASA